MLSASTLLRRQAAQWSASVAMRTQTSRRFVAVAMESRVAYGAERIPVQVHAIAQKRRRQTQRDHLYDQWLQRRADQLCRLPRVLATSPAKAHKSWIKRIAKWFRVLLHLWKLIALSAPLVITAPLVLSARTLAPSIEKQWWEYASWAAQRSTPAMMKFLQWASTRRDMFPASFCDRFESFHENAPVHTWKETEQVLRMAFGRKWREQLDIESEPIGSGCIAQVYKGKLRATGEDVAVKVIHPHVKELVALDLDLMRAAVWMIERIPRLRLLSARESVDEFAQLMDRQLNLRVEAENLVQFSNHFRNRPRGLRFPKPQMEYTTESVLIESYESGVHFHQLDSHINVKDRRAIARVVLESYLRMVFLDNFAHGDLHPGNLLFDVPSSDQSKSRHAAGVTAIDAGIVTRLEPEDLRNFVELFHAVATGNGYKAGQLIVSRSKPVGVSVDAPAEDKCTDLESFCKGMDRIVTNALSWRLKLQNVQVGALLREVMELCCNHQVKLEGKYASIVISIAVLEGVGRKLDPDLDVLSVALPIIVQSLVRNVWK
ncbi:hypothetical protein Poli38472_013930 [Pythium oligandrum]|uniref:Protein kinase domain-containing protein n=1 Tax=Pythium oligandrum TaxID=41045 RepID=A0A8K1FDS5_PYTOL|nr:hypothetical protein Poli38472_013930 [Pythium oligandrum]|eukprot:TMW55168.1 hypothetical protein Poli38472_013930 [Pythium oligandrum]